MRHEVLTPGELHPRELRHPNKDGAPDAALALGEKVHELGQEGLSKMNRVDRAHLYGQLISTCAQCHALENVAAPE